MSTYIQLRFSDNVDNARDFLAIFFCFITLFLVFRLQF